MFNREVRALPSSRSVRRLLRTCNARFDALGVPEPFDLPTLVEHLSTARRRPIHLLPAPLHGGRLSGCWIALPDIDVVVYESDTSHTHQQHIIAHEIAHIVCGHDAGAGGESTARLIFPDLDPSLVAAMLGRSTCDDEHEWEAEIMASAILGRIEVRRGEEPGCDPTFDGDIRVRLERAFPATDGPM